MLQKYCISISTENSKKIPIEPDDAVKPNILIYCLRLIGCKHIAISRVIHALISKPDSNG